MHQYTLQHKSYEQDFKAKVWFQQWETEKDLSDYYFAKAVCLIKN
jgi:hypothetical protein